MFTYRRSMGCVLAAAMILSPVALAQTSPPVAPQPEPRQQQQQQENLQSKPQVMPGGTGTQSGPEPAAKETVNPQKTPGATGTQSGPEPVEPQKK